MAIEQGLQHTPLIITLLTGAIGVWLYLEWQKYKSLKICCNGYCEALSSAEEKAKLKAKTLKIITEPAMLDGQVVAVAETLDGGAEAVAWDYILKEWVYDPDLNIGEVSCAQHERPLSDHKMDLYGIKYHAKDHGAEHG